MKSAALCAADNEEKKHEKSKVRGMLFGDVIARPDVILRSSGERSSPIKMNSSSGKKFNNLMYIIVRVQK